MPSARTSAGSGEPLVVALGVVSMSKRPDVLVDAVAIAAADRPCRLAFVGPCPPILQEMIRDRAKARGVADRVEVVGKVDDDAWRTWCDQAAATVQLRDTPTGESSAAVLEGLARGLPVLTNVASAAEYPEGTVALIPWCRADAIAGAMVDLLGDTAAQSRLAASGLVFARDHQFARLASALVGATAE